MLSVQGLTDGNTIDNTSMDSLNSDQTTKMLTKIDPDSIPLILTATATSSNETTEITTITTCESITIPALSPSNQPIQHQHLQQQPLRQLSTQLLSQPLRQQSHQQQLQQQIISKHQPSPSPSPPPSESTHVQTFISQVQPSQQQQQKQQLEHLEPEMKRQKRQSPYTEIEILDKSEVLQEQYETSSK